MGNADVKADDTMSPKNGGEVEGDVALMGEEFVVGAGAEILWIRFHRDGGGGAGGVDDLFVMWVGGGRRTRGIDKGCRGEELEKGCEGLPYSVPAQDFTLTKFWVRPSKKTFFC